MEESPGHGADVVEELEGTFSPGAIDGAGGEQDSEVGVSFFGRTKGDAEVVRRSFPARPCPSARLAATELPDRIT